MKKTALGTIAASALLFAGCSSAPPDERFCASLEEWTLLVYDLSATQQDFMDSVDFGADDLPTPEEVHDFGQRIVGIVAQADGAMADVVANTTDPAIADSLQTTHDAIAGMFGGMGQAAVEAEDFLGYVDSLGSLEDIELDLDESDSDAVDDYIYARCEDADSWGKDG